MCVVGDAVPLLPALPAVSGRGRLLSALYSTQEVSTTTNQSLLITSPATRCAATWPLELELKFFLSNNCANLRLLKCVLRDHNSNNCTHSGNVCCCTYMVNNDYDQFRSFSHLYDFISASNLHIFAWKSRQIFSFSFQWPGGSTR